MAMAKAMDAEIVTNAQSFLRDAGRAKAYNAVTVKVKQAQFTQDVEDHGYGLVTYFKVPGNFKIQLYQPKYSK